MKRKPPLKDIYARLFRAWGPQGWWPGRTRLEIAVGAILTQNTAWTNVEKAIKRLKRVGALNLQVLHKADLACLADWIRPTGYFNVKARRLRAFTTMIVDQYGGSLNKLFALDTESLRRELLAVNGIGPETADSMILYAARRPVFVIDAYTRRFMIRHGWLSTHATYDEAAELFTANLPEETPLYNEFHALIVVLGKDWCRPKPKCEKCPLKSLLPRGGLKE